MNVYSKASAVVSPCGLYRYWLERTWDDGLPVLVFVMLNPSTADGAYDDPTIRKCVGFAKQMGYGGIVVVNMFAYRSTNPRVLRLLKFTTDIVGPLNDAYLARACREGPVVCAWGANARDHYPRLSRLKELLPVPKFALHLLADGIPAHPLMLPYSRTLLPYTIASW